MGLSTHGAYSSPCLSTTPHSCSRWQRARAVRRPVPDENSVLSANPSHLPDVELRLAAPTLFFMLLLKSQQLDAMASDLYPNFAQVPRPNATASSASSGLSRLPSGGRRESQMSSQGARELVVSCLDANAIRYQTQGTVSTSKTYCTTGIRTRPRNAWQSI